ncbi:hypothetical protein EDB81DRAFT_808718 [Dactylonectria macrodidyma]|uniref:Uncharacterized protein n=1 Tax=Dactylonectria macrodidyma TaxID=307937 RepID=A0A9P9DZ18_9HYPO|nr:hypothetical protein EDB81DRAFT_808718 [Dactylonectria macrodidyma]
MSNPQEQPLAPAVSIAIPAEFQFGPTPVESHATLFTQSSTLLDLTDGAGGTNGYNGAHVTNGSEDTTDVDSPKFKATSLDVLGRFTGEFRGFGFNTIFRPESNVTPTKFPNPLRGGDRNPPDNVLELNLTSETQVFSQALVNVPNRGLGPQPNISLNGFPYSQTVSDITKEGEEPKVIHFEPGLWMRVPKSDEMPWLNASFNRMASIPHGTTINAQGFDPARKESGRPQFGEVDITPIIIAEGRQFKFDAQDASIDDARRIPQDLSKYIKAGSITQEILSNPNKVLADANEGKDIIDHTSFGVTTSQQVHELGGGTSNIGFLIGEDGGVKEASVKKRSGNANAVTMSAKYWVSTVHATIHLEPTVVGSGETGPIVSPVRNGPRDAVPWIQIDITVPRAEKIKFEYTQIQYSQMVVLDFNGLSWPHATVGTLAPADLKLSTLQRVLI